MNDHQRSKKTFELFILARDFSQSCLLAKSFSTSSTRYKSFLDSFNTLQVSFVDQYRKQHERSLITWFVVSEIDFAKTHLSLTNLVLRSLSSIKVRRRMKRARKSKIDLSHRMNLRILEIFSRSFTSIEFFELEIKVFRIQSIVWSSKINSKTSSLID